jgi:hypothetical protein
MKRILFGLCLCLVVSCTASPEKKAELLIKDAVLKTLVLPDTYQSVETVLDSAYAPMHDPDFISTIIDLYQKGKEVEELEDKLRDAKSRMAMWSSSFKSAYTQNELDEAKKDFEAAQKRYDALAEKIQTALAYVMEKGQKEPEFIGYRASHSFRAKNNAGNTILATEYFLFDKEITKVVAEWSEDDIAICSEFISQLSEMGEIQH